LFTWLTGIPLTEHKAPKSLRSGGWLRRGGGVRAGVEDEGEKARRLGGGAGAAHAELFAAGWGKGEGALFTTGAAKALERFLAEDDWLAKFHSFPRANGSTGGEDFFYEDPV
jgi:hypothetical protein